MSGCSCSTVAAGSVGQAAAAGSVSGAVLAQPAGTVQGRIRLTEQGEMISRRFGDQPTARRNLDALTAATLVASLKKPADVTDPRWRDMLASLSSASPSSRLPRLLRSLRLIPWRFRG